MSADESRPAMTSAIIDASVFLPYGDQARHLTWQDFVSMRRATKSVTSALGRGSGSVRVVAQEDLVSTWRGVLLLDLLEDTKAVIYVTDGLVPALAREAEVAPRAKLLSRAHLPPQLDDRRFSGWRFENGRFHLVRAKPARPTDGADAHESCALRLWADVDWPEHMAEPHGEFEEFVALCYDEKNPLSAVLACPEGMRGEPRARAARGPSSAGNEYAQCRECPHFFRLSDSERAWFRERKLRLPVRCAQCRRNSRSDI